MIKTSFGEISRVVRLKVSDVEKFNEDNFWNDMELIPDTIEGEKDYYYLLDHKRELLFGGYLKNGIYEGVIMYSDIDDEGFLRVEKDFENEVTEEELHQAYENFLK